MKSSNRFAIGLAIGVSSMALSAGCRSDPGTAGRRAAPYDEAQRRGAVAAPPPAGAMDHAAMRHGAATALPSPEPASATAKPGQPVATLRPDSLDAPAPTAVKEAARSKEMAASGHTMSHGTYRHVDAGRADGPAKSPAADPHAGHVMPSPPPKPPRENR